MFLNIGTSAHGNQSFDDLYDLIEFARASKRLEVTSIKIYMDINPEFERNLTNTFIGMDWHRVLILSDDVQVNSEFSYKYPRMKEAFQRYFRARRMGGNMYSCGKLPRSLMYRKHSWLIFS